MSRKSYPFVSFRPTLLASVMAMVSASPLAAADMEEVVVTADFRGASELSTPHSLTIVSEAVIAGRGATHFEEVVGAIPNLNFAGGTGRARFFQIRGIGERSQFADPINPSVGFLIDNVDFSGAGSVATLMDVSQIEVLRGPQGTRYGANALAGLVNITTNDPSDVFTSRLEVGAGNYGARTVSSVLSGPAGDDIGWRLAARVGRGDGFTTNTFLGRDDVNYRDETAVRGKLTLTDEGYDTTLTAALMDIDNGYDAFSLDNTRTTLSDEPGHDRQRSTMLSLDHTVKRNTFDIQLIAGVSDSDTEYGYDEDWTFAGIHPLGYSSTDTYFRNRATRSLELRLKSNADGAIGHSDWVIGVYVLSSDEDLTRIYTYLPGPFTSTYDFTTTALFAELDTAFTERLSATTGIRIERRDTSYGDSDGIGFEPEDSLWGGTISLQYVFDNDLLGYASLARGYKAGGFNTDGTLDADLREFDSEYLWELELGLKGYALSDTLRLRTAIFYDLRRDQQVKSSIVRQRAGGSTEFIDFLGNAAEGTNVGVEFEADWYVSTATTVFLNLGLLAADFDEFINEFGDDLSGREQAHAPSYTFNVGVDYASGPWSARLWVDGKDAFYFSDRHAVQSDSHALIGGRVAFQHRQWEVSLWGRNLTDRDYQVRGFGSFGNDPRKGYVVEPYVQYGEPRVLGISLDYTL